MALVIDGKKIANNIKKEIYLKLKDLRSKYKTPPKLSTIIIGNNRESETYFRLRERVSSDIGIKSELYRFSEDVGEREVIEIIDELNDRKDVHGIILQQPIPNHISTYNLLSRIDPMKDIEGLTPYNLGNLILGREDIIPCTPMAVLKILEYINFDLRGKDAVIINHSPIVGKPLSILLLNRNATVTVCHIYTGDLKRCTKNADLVITATGVPGLITSNHIKDGAVVIDVGITKTEDGIYGDVDFDSVKEIASVITPVPGGVGPITVALSLYNLVNIYRRLIK